MISVYKKQSKSIKKSKSKLLKKIDSKVTHGNSSDTTLILQFYRMYSYSTLYNNSTPNNNL